MKANAMKTILGGAALALLASCGGTGTGVSGSSGSLPAGTHLAFIASFTNSQIQSYAINASTGAISALGSPLSTGSNPWAVVVTPDGKFVYASNEGGASLSAYAVNANGTLTALGTVSTLPSPAGMAIDPAGKFLYAACSGSSAICGFKINADGSLTELDANPGTPTVDPFPAGNAPACIAVDPLSGFAVVGNATDRTLGLYTFNATTGALAYQGAIGIGGVGTNPSAVVMDPTGTLVFSTESGGGAVDAFSLNRGTASLSSLGAFASGSGPFALALDGSGSYLYAANFSANTLTPFTVGSGGLGYPSGSQVDTPSGLNPSGLATDGSDRILLAACYGSNSVQAYGINTDGSLVALGSLQTVLTGPQGIAIH
ncbi:MAG: beta-propeller fold lactonase family protein [Acidobacteria bacterium]|nr:beta-propeller fold lactonase family protein [Acidobacteriota bacterium]